MPSSPSCGTSAIGKVPARWCSVTSGRNSASTQSRTASRTIRSSSDRSASIAVVVDAAELLHQSVSPVAPVAPARVPGQPPVKQGEHAPEERLVLLDVVAKDPEPGVGVEIPRHDGGPRRPRSEIDDLEARAPRLGVVGDEDEDQVRPLPPGDREQGMRAPLRLDEQVLAHLGPIADLDDARGLGRVPGRGRQRRLEVRDQVLAALARRRLGVDDRGEREAGPAKDRLHQGDRDAPLDLEEVHGSARPGRRVVEDPPEGLGELRGRGGGRARRSGTGRPCRAGT